MTDYITCEHCSEVSHIGGLIGQQTNNCPKCGKQCLYAPITAHRNPTRSEINFGHGAIHYKDFPRSLWLKADKTLKQWIVCPIDGLRYYRSRY